MVDSYYCDNSMIRSKSVSNSAGDDTAVAVHVDCITQGFPLRAGV